MTGELHDSLQPETLHIYAKNEHVGPIEISIFKVKDISKSTYH